MKHEVIPKKLALSTLFVVMLTIPTVLGAIPLKVVTPVGVVSTEVSEAEARNRNTSANRPRSLTARNAGANRIQSFSANRTSYTVNVRQSTNRADIRIGIREGQQHRWRIDTRNAQGNWRNGSYNSWRARATRNINRDVRVSVSQGQERRLRVQIRDTNGNVRTITVNVRRASGNTWGANLRANAGTFNPATFNRAVTNYTLTIPHDRTAATQVGMRAEQERGQARNRVRIQNADGSWRAWSSWSSYTRAQSNRNVGTIPQGRQAQVQFMIRGAFSNMSNSPTRTRTYTVNVVRPEAPAINEWDVLRFVSTDRGDPSSTTAGTFCRPFHPDVFNYTLTVRGSNPTYFRAYMTRTNPDLWMLRSVGSGWGDPWRFDNASMIGRAAISTFILPQTDSYTFQLRKAPSGECPFSGAQWLETRTYTINVVRIP